MYPQYMCILLYVTLIWCNSISYMYCQLEWGVYVSSVYYILLYVCNTLENSGFQVFLVNVALYKN